MLGGAEYLAPLGLVVDAVDAGDQLERLLRLGHITGLEELATRVSKASAAKPFALLFEWVVAPIIIATEGAVGFAKRLDGRVTPARELESISRQTLTHEGPDKGLRLLLCHFEGRLVHVNEEVLTNRLEERLAQGLELLASASK